MTLGIRKLIVAGLIGGVFVTANALVLAHWLSEVGAVDLAVNIRREFVTGTAITVIVALLILLVGPQGGASSRRCPVCDKRLRGGGAYCSSCGSKV